MLSYRHAFHAGNHADVLKHFVLFLILDYFNQKDKPYWYIDTHAGAGEYDLRSEYAEKTKESQSGFELLAKVKNLPEKLKEFVALIGKIQAKNPHYYPGSPKIAAAAVRSTENLRLFELHPSDSKHLIAAFRGSDRKTQIKFEDGFQGLISLLPPPTRRAVILTDPSYEEKTDYDKVVHTLKDALERFETGCYLIWYPCLSRVESKNLPTQLKKIRPDNYLDVRLHVKKGQKDSFGMFGSGMFVINPPYPLQEQLQNTLPILTDILAQSKEAYFELDAKIK